MTGATLEVDFSDGTLTLLLNFSQSVETPEYEFLSMKLPWLLPPPSQARWDDHRHTH